MERTDMKEKADNPLTTPRAQISRREGLKLSATSIMASLLPVSAPAAAESQSSPQKENTVTDKAAIRPFQVSFPDADLVELRRRVNATRWPARETVPDATQGVQFATITCAFA
jgi:hypothetical protein